MISSAIPRHQLELRTRDYAAIAKGLCRPDRDAVSRFERGFAAYVGSRHAIAVSSGRLAMHLILEAEGASPGDEAIVPAFNLFAVIERFCQLGVVPRFADIRQRDLNIDPDSAERLISRRTRYLLVTHMFGHAADMDRLSEIARRHDLTLIEDCAHALGTKHRGRFVGTFGKAAIFSFSVLKLATTFGGGMITTNDDALAGRIRLRQQELRSCQPKARGLKKAAVGAVMDVATRGAVFTFAAWPALRALRVLRPDIQKQVMTEIPRPSRNFDPAAIAPLHSFQAALGASQLTRVEDFIQKRRSVGQWLDQELEGAPGVQLLQSAATCRWNGLYYGILVDRAEALCEQLFRRGIDCETSEYLNCADLPMYAEHFVDCPAARDVQSRILRLPSFPRLAQEQATRIANTIRRFTECPATEGRGSLFHDRPVVAGSM